MVERGGLPRNEVAAFDAIGVGQQLVLQGHGRDPPVTVVDLAGMDLRATIVERNRLCRVMRMAAVQADLACAMGRQGMARHWQAIHDEAMLSKLELDAHGMVAPMTSARSAPL